MSKNNRSSRRISNALAGIGTFAVLACVAFIVGHYILNHQAAPTTMASHGGPNTTSNVMGTNNSIQGVSNTTQVSTPESQSSTNVASSSSNGYSSIASAAVKVHSYTTIIQAANAINTIQQGFGQFDPSGPNVDLSNGISAEFSGGAGQSGYKWAEGRWTILSRFWGASSAGQHEAQQIVSYLHTHMLSVPQDKGVITVIQPSSSSSPTDCQTTVAWQDRNKVYELQQTGNPTNALQTVMSNGQG